MPPVEGAPVTGPLGLVSPPDEPPMRAPKLPMVPVEEPVGMLPGMRAIQPPDFYCDRVAAVY